MVIVIMSYNDNYVSNYTQISYASEVVDTFLNLLMPITYRKLCPCHSKASKV